MHAFWAHLQQPEYVHVLLNPIPVYGMATAVLALLLSIASGSRSSVRISLVLIVAVVLLTWAAFHYGERGYDRVLAMSGTDAQQWLQVHMDRAEHWLWLLLGTGAIALVALIVDWKRPAKARALVYLTLLSAIASVGVSAWISQAGGQVRHSEFRSGPP